MIDSIRPQRIRLLPKSSFLKPSYTCRATPRLRGGAAEGRQVAPAEGHGGIAGSEPGGLSRLAARGSVVAGAMQELIPLLSGFAMGVALGAIRPSLRLSIGASLAIVLGVLATVVTGEFKTSWAFVLIDVPLVAVSAVCGLAVSRPAARRMLGTG
jgi:hypothetical protein